MNPLWRTILFFTFAGCFLISAPLVVLYTAGYRYEFDTTQIVKTGVLSVTSLPKGASVFLRNELSAKKTPAVIDNVTPGTLDVRVEKEGYITWQKTVPVVSGRSTFITNALLFLDQPSAPLLSTNPIMLVEPYSESRFAYLVKNDAVSELWIKDTSYLQDKPLASFPHQSASTYQISWSKDGVYLLLKETSKKNLSTFTLLRTYDGIRIPLPAEKPTDVWFDADENHLVKFTDELSFQLFDIDSKKQTLHPPETDDVISKNGKTIRVQSSDQSIVSYVDAQGLSSIITYLPLGHYRFLHAPGNLLLLEESVQHHYLLLDLSQEKSLIFNAEVRHAAWSPSEDQLLFSNAFDIQTFTPSTRTTQTLTRFSEPMTDLAWYPVGNTILFSQATSVHALEIEDARIRQEITLVQDGNTIQNLWVSKDGSRLFYFGKNKTDEGVIFERVLQK